MTRRLVPVLVVALVVLAGCTAPSTQPAPTDGSTTVATGTPTTDASTTTGSGGDDADDGSTDGDAADANATAANPGDEAPPGVTLAGNASGALANASALLAAHERVLYADGYRATLVSQVAYGPGPATNATAAVVAGPGGDRLRVSMTRTLGNQSAGYELFANESTAVMRLDVRNETQYRNAGGPYTTTQYTGVAQLANRLDALNFSVANVTERDGRDVYTLTASKTVSAHPNASAARTNGTYDATLVVDERGLLASYRVAANTTRLTRSYEWTVESLDASPTRPDWLSAVPTAARRNVSVEVDVRREHYPNPNGTGYVENHGTFTVTNDGPDALPPGTNVSITSNGTTYATTVDRAIAAGETVAFARVDGDLVVRANASAFDDPPNFANEIDVSVSAGGVSLVSLSSSYSSVSVGGDDGPDDEVTENATQYAPGVTSDGVVYADRLVDNHTAAVTATGFKVRGTETDVFSENGTTTSRSSERVVVVASTNRTRVLERTVHDDGRVVTAWKRGRHRLTRVDGNETLYRPRTTIHPASSLAVPVSTSRALAAGEFEVVNVTERDGRTFVTLTADSADPPYDGVDVQSFDARVVVDETGRIHAFRANATYVDAEDGDVWGGSASFELVSTSEGAPLRPSWVEDVPANARRDVAASTDVDDRSRVALTAYGEHAVPAGTTVVVTIAGDRYETTLDSALDPETTRYLYVVDDELRVATERADAVGRRLVDPSSVRVVTPDGVLLEDDDLYLPATNDSATVAPAVV
ncbi:hypothetical protein [Halorubellus salinus]|uniref:hypothetical protein n=1 Tax=Halorubellus salinus TaxID=755309 RepID=UPI001D05CC23|nr:hypothetical protein [Halorubellus salinus]